MAEREEEAVPMQFMFFLADVQIFKKNPDKERAEQIWETFFSKGETTMITTEAFQEVSTNFQKGPPYPQDLFDVAYREVFHTAVNRGPIYSRLQNFAAAAIYACGPNFAKISGRGLPKRTLTCLTRFIMRLQSMRAR